MLTAVNGGTGGAIEQTDTGDDIPRTKRIELDPYIEVNGRTYTYLDLEEPTGNMVERAEAELANGTSVHALRRYQLALVSHGAKVAPAVVQRMRITQIEEAFRFLTSFGSGGRATGAS